MDHERFCRDADEWRAFAERLKQTPCPHCNVVGSLIRHGCFHDPREKTVRARRIFCSNRNARPGCGRTFSVWFSDKIRRLSLNASALWHFLQLAVVGAIQAAGRAIDDRLSDRTWQRIWKRFRHAQSKIRTALCGHCPPPQTPPRAPPTKPSRLAAAQVLAHLQAAFPDVQCPIAAYQHALNTFFV